MTLLPKILTSNISPTLTGCPQSVEKPSRAFSRGGICPRVLCTQSRGASAVPHTPYDLPPRRGVPSVSLRWAFHRRHEVETSGNELLHASNLEAHTPQNLERARLSRSSRPQSKSSGSAAAAVPRIRRGSRRPQAPAPEPAPPASGPRPCPLHRAVQHLAPCLRLMPAPYSRHQGSSPLTSALNSTSTGIISRRPTHIMKMRVIFPE